MQCMLGGKKHEANRKFQKIESLNHKVGLKLKYKKLRTEVAEKYFDGVANFEIIFTKHSSYKGKGDSDLWRSEL